MISRQRKGVRVVAYRSDKKKNKRGRGKEREGRNAVRKEREGEGCRGFFNKIFGLLY